MVGCTREVVVSDYSGWPVASVFVGGERVPHERMKELRTVWKEGNIVPFLQRLCMMYGFLSGDVIHLIEFSDGEILIRNHSVSELIVNDFGDTVSAYMDRGEISEAAVKWLHGINIRTMPELEDRIREIPFADGIPNEYKFEILAFASKHCAGGVPEVKNKRVSENEKE